MIYKILLIATLVTSCGMEDEIKDFVNSNNDESKQELIEENETNTTQNEKNVEFAPATNEVNTDEVNVTVNVNVNTQPDDAPKVEGATIDDFFTTFKQVNFNASGEIDFTERNGQMMLISREYEYGPANNTWVFQSYLVTKLTINRVVYDAFELDNNDGTVVYLYVDNNDELSIYGTTKDWLGHSKNLDAIELY